MKTSTLKTMQDPKFREFLSLLRQLSPEDRLDVAATMVAKAKSAKPSKIHKTKQADGAAARQA